MVGWICEWSGTAGGGSRVVAGGIEHDDCARSTLEAVGGEGRMVEK